MVKNVAYLVFLGNAEEAFNFYKQVFNGELFLQRYSEVPKESMANSNISEEDKKKVMHVALSQDGKPILMGTDSVEGMGPKFEFGNNFFISCSPDSFEEAESIFNALSEDGEVVMPMQEQFWGDMFGMCNDKYGVRWMLDCKKPE